MLPGREDETLQENAVLSLVQVIQHLICCKVVSGGPQGCCMLYVYKQMLDAKAMTGQQDIPAKHK